MFLFSFCILSALALPTIDATNSVTSYIPFTLNPGEIIKHGLDLDFFSALTSKVAITSFQADIVYAADDTRVPLSQVYIHHWTVQGTNRVNSGSCHDHVLKLRHGSADIDFMFGIGSETLGEAFAFPNKTGVIVGPDDGNWTVELHAIDLRGTPDPLACRECTCLATGVTDQGPYYVGGLDCCNDDGSCVDADQTDGPEDYFFRYTIEYETDIAAITPLYIMVTTAPGFDSRCDVEYDIPRGTSGQNLRHRIFTAPADAEIVFMLMHMHSGAVKGTFRRISTAMEFNATTESAVIASTLEFGEVICSTSPEYDSGGYIVGMSGCDTPFKISAGEQFLVSGLYDNTGGLNETTYPQTAHVGVMTYVYLAGFPL